MRRLPIYFLIDVSESMVGEPIQQVGDGMKTIIQELRTDPYALETAYVSVIVFAGKAKTLSSLTELCKFLPPRFPVGGGTSLGVALEHLMNSIDHEVVKTTAEMKGDWKPIVFLFTDGNPTDQPQHSFDRWNSKFRRAANLVCVSLGDNADVNLLKQISDDVFKLKDTDKDSFKAFFKWVTASIKATSLSVSEMNSDDVQLASTEGINLEKVGKEEPRFVQIDENFTILLGKCQTTNRPYLIKYAKRGEVSSELESIRHLPDVAGRFKLVGAYPIEEEEYTSLCDGCLTHQNINTNELVGSPECPICGNQYGFIKCTCGSIHCSDEDRYCKCPWCNEEGYWEYKDEFEIERQKG